jgi:tRNA(adenine34) deaminase
MRQNQFMQLAIQQAEIALQINEMPVGAVIIDENYQVLAKAHNLTKQNVCYHAEFLAIQQALTTRKFLDKCSLYVSLEPCFMCFGAILLTRISKVFYALDNQKYGSISNNLANLQQTCYQMPEIYNNIGSERASEKLLQQFFTNKR